MSLVIKFDFTSSMLNMFRTSIHPSSEACDFSIVLPHWSCVLVSMCVGVSILTVLSWLCTNKYLERVVQPENGKAVLCCIVCMSSEILVLCLGFVRHLLQVITFVATNISTQTLRWVSNFLFISISIIFTVSD